MDERASEPKWKSSGRYTPPLDRLLRRHPLWHRWAGGALVIAGLAIFIANDVTRALPGGHSEGYALLAILVAGASLWFFGLFDRPT